MNGNGIMYYFYDDRANVQGLKMRYQPMTQLANNFVILDRQSGYNPTRDTTKTPDILKQYPTGYPLSNWAFKTESNKWRALPEIGLTARATIANDSEYNESLREACKWKGLVEAQRITAKRSGLRYRGQIALKGTVYNPGDLIRITNKLVGINSQLLRVLEVSHRIDVKGWETTIEVEEDEKTIYGQNYA
jgi:hypothetical protein